MLLAIVLPGLGHVSLGKRRRGLMIAVGVLGLFASGLLVGGIGSVDSGLFFANRVRALTGSITGSPVKLERVEGGEPVWFVGQMFIGPIAFSVDLIHHYRFKVRDLTTGALRAPLPDEGRDPATGMSNGRGSAVGGQPSYRRGLGRVGEIGTLFCTIAGMLNLIAIIDAGWSRRARPGDADPQPKSKTGARS